MDEQKLASTNVPSISSRDKAATDTLAFLTLLFEGIPRDFTVRLWNGFVSTPEPGRESRFTLVVNSPGALWRALIHPGDLSMGEAYIYNDIDIEGDIYEIFEFAGRLQEKIQNHAVLSRLAFALLPLRSYRHDNRADGSRAARLKGFRHSKERDRQAISYHYDVSDDFYRLFLDKNLIYSCAYFPTGTEDLDAAQELKMEHICRKLRLKPGERFLDIGCGWGALVVYAAKHYGVEALGITLSRNQYEYAQDLIKREGLEDRCRVDLKDYRDVEGSFDKLVSIEMFEHVGGEKLSAYFRKAWDLLKPGGLFLNDGVACRQDDCAFRKNSFANRYVFPDVQLVSISTSLKRAEEAGFEVRDVESLREHYARTAKIWLSRLEKNHEEALKYVDETTYRIWRLYMAGSAYGFEKGMHNLYQSLLVKAPDGKSGMPWSRGYMYPREGNLA